MDISKKRRLQMDIRKLVARYVVNFVKGLKEFVVSFTGPEGTPYEGGHWVIRIDIPEQYPFQSPSVGFVNKIYHPNVDESSGSVCLDVISQKWSSIYELSHIFDHFLPQLLQEPNVADPLNQSAAQHLGKDPISFRKTVIDYVQRYATMSHVIKTTINSIPDEIDEAELKEKIESFLQQKSMLRSRSLSFTTASSNDDSILASPTQIQRNNSDPLVNNGPMPGIGGNPILDVMCQHAGDNSPGDPSKLAGEIEKNSENDDDENFDDESSLSAYSGQSGSPSAD